MPKNCIPVNVLLTFLVYNPAIRPPAAQGSSGPLWRKSVKKMLRSKKKVKKVELCGFSASPF